VLEVKNLLHQEGLCGVWAFKSFGFQAPAYYAESSRVLCCLLEASSLGWCPGLVSSQYLTSIRCAFEESLFNKLLALKSWNLHNSPWDLASCTCRKWGVEGGLDLIGMGVTRMASVQLEVSLSLTDKRTSKSQLDNVLLLACSVTWRFCWASDKTSMSCGPPSRRISSY